MSLLGRAAGTRRAAAMPVVFTSFLGGPGFDALDAMGRCTFMASQTPQVWLDHVTAERRGALAYHWDYVVDLFPPQLVATMFQVYGDFLDRLATRDELWSTES